ncbi:hypothetical protein [Microbulbifer litoralis]|nr:hypothetical protein [Microbulbifer sp. GX H0434]
MNLWGSLYLHITRQGLEFHPPWYHFADREASAPQPERHARRAMGALLIR